MRGRIWEPRLAEFAEQVMARRPQARVHDDAEPRWDQTAYLGARWGTTELWVADASGAVRRVMTIRRMPLADRWSPEMVGQTIGVPDDPGCKTRSTGARGRTRSRASTG